ncbi:MAG TPA: alpha/beta hydrolase [Aggregatilinea sp.]|uniref:alpha/beta fold hydrolase n=1 Tax=Aggregatilinea sp. TaxID=2806333 RepID=UPI002B9FBE14|nr:alpha/beta hydrolase [Aggregatilinea sp.]HML20690.1 alpha/beta hydrolase [Aggregatilinea sp.]
MMHRTVLKPVLAGLLTLCLTFSFTVPALAQGDEPALPPATQSGMAPVNDIEVYYATYGDPANEPLLLLHGGLGNADYFVNQIPAFSENYYVITMDSRGHGRSTMSDQQIGYALMASDVLALLDYLEIDAVNLVGWSDGGIIGLDIAINHPERLLKLIAYGANYNPSGVKDDIDTSERFNEYIEMAAEDYVRLSPNPDNFDAFLENIGNMWATEPNYSVEQMMGITVPTLILDGIQEEAIYPSHDLEMATLIPDADLVLMGGVGHFAMWEATEEFNHIILDYLSR